MIDEERLLQTFLEYVRIDSETLQEKDMAARLADDLRALGAKVWTDHAGREINSEANNVYARLEGKAEEKTLLFSAHMDTVKPGRGICPIVENGLIHSDGNTILAADDKSGIAAIIEALRTVVDRKIPHCPIEVLFSIAEEGGLRGAKHADYSTLDAKQAVVLDSSGNVGQIVTSAPGQIKLYATITGRAAHAGASPEKGVSAIQAAATGVAAMQLLRIDEETTANIGTFKAEYETNIVPEKAFLIGEARSRNPDKLEAQAAHMKQCLQNACDRYGAQLDCEIETAYLSYNLAEDDELVQKVADACGRIGVNPSFMASGGGSDANIMNRNGIQAVVLATGMEMGHTTSEQISVENLRNAARLCLELMRQ